MYATNMLTYFNIYTNMNIEIHCMHNSWCFFRCFRNISTYSNIVSHIFNIVFACLLGVDYPEQVSTAYVHALFLFWVEIVPLHLLCRSCVQIVSFSFLSFRLLLIISWILLCFLALPTSFAHAADSPTHPTSHRLLIAGCMSSKLRFGRASHTIDIMLQVFWKPCEVVGPKSPSGHNFRIS